MTITEYKSKGHTYILVDHGGEGLWGDLGRRMWFHRREVAMFVEGVEVTSEGV